MIWRRIVILLLVLAAGLHAQDAPSNVEFWNWFFWEAFDNGKFRVRGVAQLRSQPHRDTFLRAQGGPILEWQVNKRWNLIAGYYFQESRQSGGDVEFQGAHRPFAGFEFSHPIHKRVSFETRHLYEYFKSLSRADTMRGRGRARFEFKLPLSPFVQNEVFYDGLGVQANRSEAGVEYKFSRQLRFQLSTFREIRPQRAGGDRTVISTRITFYGPWNSQN